MSCSSQWKSVLMMIAVNFAFALVNIFIKKVLNEGMNYLIIITYRQAIAAIFLAPIAFFWERKSRPKLTAGTSCQLFFSALMGVTLSQYSFLIGLEYTSATFSCAFLNTVPVNTFILALLLGMERANIKSKAGRAKVIGTLVCICGALLLTLYRGMPLANSHSSTATIQLSNHDNSMVSDKKTKNWAIGSLLLITGCLLWSSWFLIQARISDRYPCQYSSTAILSFFSAIQSATLSIIIERNAAVWVVRGKMEILSVMYAGMVGSGLCYVAMSWCVKQRGPVFTAAFIPFTQIFVAVFDLTILQEAIYLGSVVGSFLVVIGLYILLWGKSNEAEECVVKQVQTSETDGRLPVTMNSTSS